MTEEESLWAAVGANPADSLPRMVLADWYEERAGKKDCPVCPPDEGEEWHPEDIVCAACSGSRRISNGDEETAAALRATADRIPYPNTPGPHREYWWCVIDDDYYPVNGIPTDVFRRLVGEITYEDMRDYPTALAAINDLCAAWVKVHKVEVQS